MLRESRVLVHVSDNELMTIKEAEVEVTLPGTRSRRRAQFEPSLERYVCRDLEPDKLYRVTVRCDGLERETRDVKPHAGDQSVFVQLAPPDTPHYVAGDHEKVFFKEDPQRLLVYAGGAGARDRAVDLLKGAGRLELEFRDPPGSRPLEHQALFEVRLAGATAERSRTMKAVCDIVKRSFPESGLRGRVALTLVRGSDPAGREVVEGLTNELVVRFASWVTKEEVQRLTAELELHVDRELPWIPNGWLLSRPGVPSYDILELVRTLDERQDVVYAEPNLLFEITLDAYAPNDFLYPEQPHFEVINAHEAWDRLDDIDPDLRSGSPDICVAVFDSHGVAPNHPDLTGVLTDGSAKMVACWDFVTMAPQTVANLDGDHGTECASSAVGGFDNTTGATGLAGNCKLIGAETPAARDGVEMAEAWMWAAGLPTNSPDPSFPATPAQPADVISNSWGVPGGVLTNAIRDGLDHLATFGRSGKGCVVCFSVGNLGYRQFSNVRRYAAYEKTIAVGASINANPTSPVDAFWGDPAGNFNNLPAVADTRAFYSPYGPEMDIVAPSHTCYDLTTEEKVDPIVAAVQVDEGHWSGEAATVTTSNAAVAAGAAAVPVASTAGFAAGEVALLEMPGVADREFVDIVGIAGGQLQVTALGHAHAAGIQVSTGPNDYDRVFGGTSHSCPTVAGAAALILSVKPELTWVQVREILRNSAEQIDAAQANAVGQWVDTDGDGLDDFSQWYGYGRLNMDQAIIDTVAFSTAADVVIRDNLTDTGVVPSTGWHAHSPDIWVRRTDDPIPALAYGDPPPHQRPWRGQDNYVFLRARNVGTAVTNEVYLRALITHFPGFEFRYPDEWMPSTRPGDPIPSPLAPGTYLIGEVRIDELAAGASTIVKMTWDEALIPPEQVMVDGTMVTWHPCVLAEVSPHDGPAPAGATGFPVKHDNNLAHRNIAVDDADQDTGDDVACGVMAGTSNASGVDSVILDRSELSPATRVFIRPADRMLWKRWLDQMERTGFKACDPLPTIGKGHRPDPVEGEEDSEESSEVTILDPARVRIEGRVGPVIVHAAPGTRLEHRIGISSLLRRPWITRGKHTNQEVLIFSAGGAQTVELPLRLASRQFTPVVVGLKRPAGSRGVGMLKATQRLGDGEISAGFTIEG